MPIKLHATVWQRQNVLSWRDSNADPSVSYADAKNHCAIPLGPNIDIDIAQLTPFKLKQFFARSGGVAQWTSHSPQEQTTRVRIPPEHKVLG
jgi:hypothetical protein